MIELHEVSKTMGRRKAARIVLDRVTAVFEPGLAYGILARPGQGKSTFIQLLCGGAVPDSGRIIRNGSVSFPLGYAGWLNNELTGSENIAFMARLYGQPVDDFVAAVFGFAELDPGKDRPLRFMTPVERTKICYAISFLLCFDTQLIDESIGVGDAVFRAKCLKHLLIMRERQSLIVTGSNWTVLARLCDVGCTLHAGQLEMFASIKDARDYLDWLAPLPSAE
jgi:capsular polysaccharide transport system ATP-binding protein